MGRSVVLTLAFAFVSVASASGQSLAAGTWEGDIVGPGGEFLAVEFQVEHGAEGLTIDLIPPPDVGAPESIPLTDIRLEDDVLYFMFSPGVDVDCELALQDDGSYSGDCTDPDGESGQVTMYPPKSDE